jgi:hypothetical protein
MRHLPMDRFLAQGPRPGSAAPIGFRRAVHLTDNGCRPAEIIAQPLLNHNRHLRRVFPFFLS